MPSAMALAGGGGFVSHCGTPSQVTSYWTHFSSAPADDSQVTSNCRVARVLPVAVQLGFDRVTGESAVESIYQFKTMSD